MCAVCYLNVTRIVFETGFGVSSTKVGMENWRMKQSVKTYERRGIGKNEVEVK
jgi:hypothetical protein